MTKRKNQFFNFARPSHRHRFRYLPAGFWHSHQHDDA
jgi:hypothetical protein